MATRKPPAKKTTKTTATKTKKGATRGDRFLESLALPPGKHVAERTAYQAAREAVLDAVRALGPPPERMAGVEETLEELAFAQLAFTMAGLRHVFVERAARAPRGTAAKGKAKPVVPDEAEFETMFRDEIEATTQATSKVVTAVLLLGADGAELQRLIPRLTTLKVAINALLAAHTKALAAAAMGK